jgi:hypothetical protein
MSDRTRKTIFDLGLGAIFGITVMLQMQHPDLWSYYLWHGVLITVAWLVLDIAMFFIVSPDGKR